MARDYKGAITYLITWMDVYGTTMYRTALLHSFHGDDF